jgi:UDP-N-acetylglucosamine transferase subunit ALG13
MKPLLVTVGTHEQPFDRLLRAVDELADSDGRIRGMPVFCQFGYTTYVTKVQGQAMLASTEFERRLAESNVVVTHGGPGSIMPGLRAGQRLVLVPRQQRFGEHVDDHQIAFCRRLSEHFDIPIVEDIADLASALDRALASSKRAPQGGVRDSEAIQRLSQIMVDMVTPI